MAVTAVSTERRSISDLVTNYQADPLMLSRLSSLLDRQVVLDCSDIDRVSSEDLNTLIRFQGKLRQESICLVLANVSETVAEVFRLTRLNRLIVVREAMEEHVSSTS